VRCKHHISHGLIGCALTFIGLLAITGSATAQSAVSDPTAEQNTGIGARIAGLFDRLIHPNSSFIWPVAAGHVTSTYGMRLDPVLGTWHLHSGVDFAAAYGTPIMAAADGTVVSAGWESGYGYTTRIEHANGVETTYAHQSNIEHGIEPGVRVTQGEVIGEVGATGYATGPHLHYEVSINGATVDPLGAQAQQVGIVAAATNQPG
jgi:murein DD-endopeptidase MepM/ murein hydrolase activator NlpD